MGNGCAMKCDSCGRFVCVESLADGTAKRVLLTPDSEFTREEWETLCAGCCEKEKRHG